MKVLWITNIVLPPLATALGRQSLGSGGWLHASMQALREQDATIEFAVATLGGKGVTLKREIDGVTYYLLPHAPEPRQYMPEMEQTWRGVCADFCPDVVHIHGSEFTHGLAYARACGNDNVVLSIQGMISIINRFCLAGITDRDIRRNMTLKEFLRRGLGKMQKRNEIRSGVEQCYLHELKHVIGRTSWDRAHTRTINPDIRYHFCNETLRPAFYGEKWSAERCERHSIFISQGMSPLKGFHKVLEALPFILQKYPDTMVYVAGSDIAKADTLKDRLMLSGYGNILHNLIEKNNLKQHVRFMGLLSAEQMAEAYLKSNVFICPSSIENSPNSLGEAQLLGVPCVGSFVGGVPDFIEHGKTGFIYRFEEVEMMADYVCRIFADDTLACTLGQAGHDTAILRHDKATNALATIQIYNHLKSDRK